MAVIATAGHVDHGKSSLVHALTGTDPDRFAEEKRRGMTIDLGFAHTRLGSGREISFIDVPGHARFIGNMLAGVGGVAGCLFVVAATEGWKPQTEEHLRILQLLGIDQGVIALTMIDLGDDDDTELAILDIEEHIAGTFLANAAIVPVAAPTGLGLPALSEALDVMVGSIGQSRDDGRPRLWVDRVFAAKGSGTIVTGTLTGGQLAVDDVVAVGAQRRPARIRFLQRHGLAVDSIAPGNRAAVNLSGIAHTEIRRGDALIKPSQWHWTRRFDASFQALSSLDHDVSRRGAYLAYIGSDESLAKVRVLGTESIAPGASGLVRIHLAAEVPLLPGDRYVLREAGRDETVGGGEVLDVAPIRPASKAAPDRNVDRVIAERGGWVDGAELALLTGERRQPTLGRWVVSGAVLERDRQLLSERITAAGTAGFDISALDDRQRAVLGTVADVVIESGTARIAGADGRLAEHPLVVGAASELLSPPSTEGADRSTLQALVRRRLLVHRDGIYFHPQAITVAAEHAAALLAAKPAGFTASEFREAVGTSRKFAVPLLEELDARGITRRRDQLRIAGPRLPPPAIP
jgi:selenocysteine-specific elongation factor